MSRLFDGVGGGTAPTPSGHIGRLMQRVLTLRDVSPTPEIRRAEATLALLQKAEHAAGQGLSGDRLDRLIAYLESQADRSSERNGMLRTFTHLAPAVSDAGYC